MSLTALIQGASRGIGLSMTKKLLQNNAVVIATCRNPEQAKDLHQLKQTHGDKLHVFKIDTHHESTIKDAAAEILKNHKKLDILVNSSGMLHVETALNRIDETKFLDSFRTNALGPLLVVKHFQPALQKGSKVVNLTAKVASITNNDMGGWYSYRASKTALNMITKNLAIELGRKGVIVAAVHPGVVDTDLSRPYTQSVPNKMTPDQSAEKILQLIAEITDRDNGKFLMYDKTELPW